MCYLNFKDRKKNVFCGFWAFLSGNPNSADGCVRTVNCNLTKFQGATSQIYTMSQRTIAVIWYVWGWLLMFSTYDLWLLVFHFTGHTVFFWNNTTNSALYHPPALFRQNSLIFLSSITFINVFICQHIHGIHIYMYVMFYSWHTNTQSSFALKSGSQNSVLASASASLPLT